MKKNIVILLSVLLCSCAKKPLAEIEVTKESIYPRSRQEASPRNGQVVRVNAPSLLWRGEQGKNVLYKVKMYRAGSNDTLISKPFVWAVYQPHKELDKGHWMWQYAVCSGDREKWSEIYDFVVDHTSQTFASPSIDRFVELCSKPHPRLYVDEKELPGFRKRTADYPEAKFFIRNADKHLLGSLPVEKPTQPRSVKGLSGFELQMMNLFMYFRFGDNVKEPVKDMTMAYLLTGEEKYMKKAIEHALVIAKMDPKGQATVEDFNSASVMLAMAIAYDNGYKFLDRKQKKTLLEAIRGRANHFFVQMANKFELHPMDNHGWQHVLRRLFFTAYATLGDLPEAKDWLAYCYEVWCCRFPILGGTDGGAHDGNSYFPVNFETFGYMPFYLSRITGVNFFDVEYLRNMPWYLIYAFPPHVESTQFGDQHEYLNSRPWRYVGFADLLAREFQNSYMNTYLTKLTKGNEEELVEDKMFAIYRLLADKKRPAKSEDITPDMPQSRLFKDIGVAVIHTNAANPKQGVMASFISSPYGSSGHAHANHNSFSLNVKGRKMFGSSGYYSHFSDRHTLLHYRNSRGHNTILADGLSQRIGEESYGWIARFADTGDFTYTLGDATHAYGAIISDFWLKRMKNVDIEPTKEFGFGDAGITRFRRHFIFLRPSYLVVYDELEAKQPIQWTWLLHSYYPIGNTDSLRFDCSNQLGSCDINVFSAAPLQTKIHDRYASPALNWRDLVDHKGVPLVFKNHYHLEIATRDKTRCMRYLSIFKIDVENNAIKQIKQGEYLLGDWKIEAELDGGKEPRLIIRRGNSGIFYNNNKGKYARSTIIKSKKGQEELIDTLPDSMR